MDSALLVHRIHFAFTVTFHYLFPQLTMVGLGTIFIAVMLVAALLLWRGKLYHLRWVVWTLMFCVPRPYIAKPAGVLDPGMGGATLVGSWFWCSCPGDIGRAGGGESRLL